MLKTLLALSASIAALSAAAAHAQTANADDAVVVTVTRESLPVAKIGQAIDVLTDADIKSLQSLSISDLLQHTTDLSVVRNGGPGASGSASIRGAGADHTLYLLDGIALNDPSQVGGGTDLGLLSTGDASRIEVLRGPLSTLWGSGALGGVVSITSRTATRPLEGDLSLEGFDQYVSARLGIGGKSGDLNWRLFAGGYNDRGVSAFAGGSEKDGFAQTQLSGKASYAFNADLKLNAFVLRTHNRSDLDGFPAPDYVFADDGEFSKSDTTLAAVGLTDTFSKGAQTLSVNGSETDRDSYDPDGTPNFIARGRLIGADYHISYRLSDATRFLGGIKAERDDMRTASTYSPLAARNMTTESVYGQVEQDIATATVTVSGRHDHSSSFGGQDLAQISASLPAGPFRLHASLGQGVKVPSLYQLYGDYGTPTLKPEKALSLDGGADYGYTTGQVSLTAFARDVRDLIDFDLNTYTYGNIARSKASGVEAEWRQDIGDAVRIRANYSILTTKNLSPDYNGKRLARRPDTMGSVDIDYVASQKIHLGIGVRAVGESFDDASNISPIKGYLTADLRANYNLNDTVSLYARLENITDKRYQSALGYGQPGRRLWLGVHTAFF